MCEFGCLLGGCRPKGHCPCCGRFMSDVEVRLAGAGIGTFWYGDCKVCGEQEVLDLKGKVPDEWS